MTTLLAVLSLAEDVSAAEHQDPTGQTSATAASPRQLTIFLDCQSCYADICAPR